MRNLLKHHEDYVDDELYCDETWYGSRTHLGVIDQGTQPFVANEHCAWLEGEFYNQDELRAKYDLTGATDNELLLNMYNATKSFDFLRDIDGCYVAVLYDKKKVYLIADRYGFKPLYWKKLNGDLVWSSELKGFLGHVEFDPVIDPVAVREFFKAGHLFEERTWFDGVTLLPPASVLTFDMEESSVESWKYWAWTDIEPMEGRIDEREIADELGRLFRQSVEGMVGTSERVGISLSGGLDSRAILAAVPKKYEPLHTFTFGVKGCDDMIIAARVAGIRKSHHHALELNPHYWLMPRISRVWKSDGLLSLLHMHGLEFTDYYRQHMDINLSGFLGDAVLGGAYISTGVSVESRVRNRGRRFINQALVLLEDTIIQRRPFFDNRLVAFMCSIPEELRRKSHIYKKMLLLTFPEYFAEIPWQKTGVPINSSKQGLALMTTKRRAVDILRRVSRRIGFAFRDRKGYTDYPEWIRCEPARSFFERLLLSKNALYRNYILEENVRACVRLHMSGKENRASQLCEMLTFELWLQQVFSGKYRNISELAVDGDYDMG